ncbi:hypothetical protein M1D88_17225 [Arthrobacter sp. R1-13]
MSRDIQMVLEKADEEMIFLGPDHPYYGLLAALVTSVRNAWQEGYDSASGGPAENPYGFRPRGQL